MRYDAFISYSHRADLAFAPRLQSALRSLARPWWRPAALAIFRDETDMGAASSLTGAIVSALQSSRYFILLAAPEAAASPWVAREIELWFARPRDAEFDPARRFLIALADGAIVWDEAARDFDWRRTTALPPALKGRFAEEPLWIDLTAFRDADHLTLRHPDFARAVARLAAPIRGTTPDALIGEDIKRQRQNRRWALGAAATVTLFAVGAGIGAWYGFAGQRRAEAAAAAEREQRAIAEANLAAAFAATDALVVDIGQVLVHFEGVPLEIIKSLLDRVERIFTALDRPGAADSVRVRRAALLDVLANTYLRLTDGEAARVRAEAALVLMRDLTARNAANMEWRAQLVLAHVTLGRAHLLLRQPERAEDTLRQGLAAAEAGAAIDPTGRYSDRPLAIVLVTLGDALLHQSRFEEALVPYRRALPLFERLRQAAAGLSAFQQAAFARDVAVAHNKIGEALMLLGRYDAAEAEFRAGFAVAEAAARDVPRNTDLQRDLFISHIRFGRIHEYRGDLDKAVAAYESARAIIERLLAGQPTHPLWRRDHEFVVGRLKEVRGAIEARKSPPKVNGAPAPR
jgi:tetratricopeptide (TPR) repeat protein